MQIQVLHKREFKPPKPVLKMYLLAPLLLFPWTLHGTFPFLPLLAPPGSGPLSFEVFIIFLTALSAAVSEQPGPSLSSPPPSPRILLLPFAHCTFYPVPALVSQELRAGNPEITQCSWS